MTSINQNFDSSFEIGIFFDPGKIYLSKKGILTEFFQGLNSSASINIRPGEHYNHCLPARLSRSMKVVNIRGKFYEFCVFPILRGLMYVYCLA